MPSALDGNATVKIRFYYHNGGTAVASPTGSRPKISVDNVAVNSTSAATAPTVTTNSTITSISTTGATLGGNITNINGANATIRGFEYSTSSGFGNGTGTNSTDSGDYGNGTFTKAVSSLTANTLYYLKAKAQNSAGTGWGAEASFTTLPLPPTVGTGSGATSSGFTANWSHPTMGSASYTYTVEVDDDINFGSINVTVPGILSGNTSQAITGLSPSTTYYYRIKSVNAQGDSAWSSTSAGIATSSASSPTITPTGSFSALSTFAGTVSAPSSISVSGTALTADITATRPSADFEVSSNNSTWGSTATFTQSGGSASGTLYVRIASGAAVGTPSGNVTLTSTGAATVNAAVSGTVNKVDPTAHVTNFATGTITTSNIPLTWTAAAGSPDGYLIRVSSTTVTDPTDGTAVADDTSLSDGFAAFNVTSGATTSYSSFTGFAAGTTYTFKIYPYNNSGSNIRYRTDATVPSVTGLLLPAAPSTPTFSSVSSSGFTVNWSTVTGATNYQLDLATDSGFTSMVSGYGNFTTGNVTSQAVTGLTANVTYHARLRAVNSTGTSASSTSASQTTSQLSAPVASAATSVTSSGFNANWSAVTNATNYRLDVYSNSTVTPTTTDLLITEYVEGSSNNKYIEIFNGTGATVDLSNYTLMQFTNGSGTAGSNVTLSGNLSNGQTVVYKNSSAVLTLPEGVSASNNGAVGYNGDDAVALFKISTGTYVDIIGRIGDDPGTAWTASGSYSTFDKTLRRKGTVTSGITTSPTGTGASAFTTLETEWDVFDVDTANGLGSHTLNQTTGQNYLLQDQATGNVTTYAVTGASASTEYLYRLRATSSTSTSANSNVITLTTNASATPPVVTGATLNGTVGTAFAGHTVSATNSPTGYAVESGTLPDGLSLNATTGAISGTPTAAGNSSVTINATNAAGSGNATFNFNIAKGNQTITFGAQAALGVGSTRAVGATASSGLTVTYSSSNTSVATISGGNVSGVAVGNTTITASQAGDANWNAATPVDQSLTVAVLPATWDFGTASPTNVPSGATISDVSQGNNNGSTTMLGSGSASTGYTGSSGSNNAAAAAFTGALNTSTSTYFQFSANSTSGNYITFTGISLGVRSTSTGPTTISLRSDADSYTSDIAVVTYTANSTWQLVSNSTFSQVYEGNRTFRLYGHSGTGSASASTANWRIDDLTLTLSVSAKTTPTVTVAVGSYTYDGAVKGPVSGDVSTGGSSGAITMSYEGAGGTAYSATSTRPTAAGTYTATASVAATATHNAASSAATAFTISQRSVTGSFTANNKTYDGSNSATVSGTSLSNTIGGDTVSLTGGTATFSDAAAANGKTVTLAGASLTGASSANYTLGSVNTTTANITTASVTVTAGNQTKTFGASDPTLTYTSDPASLIAGNSFSGALSRAAGEGVGTYAISQGTLSAGSNYTITFVGANLTITQATPSITTAPTASTITYGQALSSSVLSGGVANVAGSFAFTTPATVPSPGISSQGVTFTPTDTGNYTAQTTSVDVGVLCTAPVLTRASNPTGTGFTVNWGAVTGAGNYTVIHSASKNMSDATSADTTSTSLTLTVPSGILYVQVRANNAAGASANSTMQVNQLRSIAAGATAFLSVPGVVNGGNATIEEIFGSSNEAGLAANGTPSNSTNIIRLNADGDTLAGIIFRTGSWTRGDTVVNTEIIPAGKAFMLKNNSSEVDHILLVASAAEGPRSAVSISAPSGKHSLLTPARTKATPLTTLGFTDGGNNTATGIKRAPLARDADVIIIQNNSGRFIPYHFDGTNWRNNRTIVDPSTISVPSGGAFYIRKASGSNFSEWTPPAED